MNKNIAFTITGTGKVSAVIDGKPLTVETDHPNYDRILNAIKDQDWDTFVRLADITSSLKQYVCGKVNIEDGMITYSGEVIHNTLTTRILKFMREGLPFEPMVKFFDNLMQNPSKRAVDELYDFLDIGELPITEDGCFLAFKNVRSNYLDIHSGTFDNSVGSICEMPRNRVCDNKDQTCSSGLHFCSIAYLPSFSDSDGGKTMILKINPRDVVSIPADYNNTKGRTCRYEVVGEYTEDWRSKIEREESGWDSNLYTEDGEEYGDDCDCCDCDCPYCNPKDSDEEYANEPCGTEWTVETHPDNSKSIIDLIMGAIEKFNLMGTKPSEDERCNCKGEGDCKDCSW